MLLRRKITRGYGDGANIDYVYRVEGKFDSYDLGCGPALRYSKYSSSIRSYIIPDKNILYHNMHGIAFDIYLKECIKRFYTFKHN